MVIEKVMKEQCGFITDADLPEIIKEKPQQLILVRCGNGRFIAPIDQVKHFIDIIEREKSDYVRDVSIYNFK